jgi:hypothetical protein
VTRKVDKTGLIAWQSNKYSVPLAYQGARVGVCAEDGLLRISDLATGKTIAEHTLCQDKGQVIKNTDHYRDKQVQQNLLEQALQQLLGNVERATALCALLQLTSPKIYKDHSPVPNRCYRCILASMVRFQRHCGHDSLTRHV